MIASGVACGWLECRVLGGSCDLGAGGVPRILRSDRLGRREVTDVVRRKRNHARLLISGCPLNPDHHDTPDPDPQTACAKEQHPPRYVSRPFQRPVTAVAAP